MMKSCSRVVGFGLSGGFARGEGAHQKYLYLRVRNIQKKRYMTSSYELASYLRHPARAPKKPQKKQADEGGRPSFEIYPKKVSQVSLIKVIKS